MNKLLPILILLWQISAYGQLSLYLESRITVPSESVSKISMSADGRFLAYGCKEGSIYIWDLDAKRQLHRLNFHKKSITSLIFDSKNQNIISGSKDEKIAIWNLYSGQIENVIKDFDEQIKCLQLSPDNKFLAAGGETEEIYLWEFPSGFLKGKLKGHDDDIVSFSFNLNGDQLLSVGEDRLMIVWDVNRQKLIRKTEIEARTLKNSGLDIRSARFSFDRYFVAVGIQEHVLAKGGRRMLFRYNTSFYEWKTGSEIATLEGNTKDIDFSAISPDKKYLITDNSTLRANKISFWNIQTGLIEQNYPIEGKISAIETSEDGEWLAVGFTQDKNFQKSHVNIWRLSGVEGYARFNTNQQLRTSTSSGFGSAIKLTTPADPLIQFGEKKRLAVLYFDNPGLSQDIAKTTTYLLEGKLGNSSFVELIERNQIDKVLSELQYQMSGLTTSDAVEVGKQLNAKYILTGSINKLGNLLIITAKLINVETSQIEGTREVQCNNATIENIAEMVTLLAPTIAKF